MLSIHESNLLRWHKTHNMVAFSLVESYTIAKFAEGSAYWASELVMQLDAQLGHLPWCMRFTYVETESAIMWLEKINSLVPKAASALTATLRALYLADNDFETFPEEIIKLKDLNIVSNKWCVVYDACMLFKLGTHSYAFANILRLEVLWSFLMT